ncbi:hypothetical protein [Streptomyces sp. NPDC088736]|uniref:hypothetical protein n=1 Tax=Streptomyces sp. NPDC088736 TaxID=3365881 RepID=UPI0037F9C791
MDDAGRYHLLLSVDGRPAMHGWWDRRATADRQFSSWVGERGSMPGVCIELVDTAVGETLTEWPEKS